MMNMHQLEYVGVCLVFIYFLIMHHLLGAVQLNTWNEQTPQLSYHYVE